MKKEIIKEKEKSTAVKREKNLDWTKEKESPGPGERKETVESFCLFILFISCVWVPLHRQVKKKKEKDGY